MSIDLSLDRLKRLIVHLPPYTRPTLHIAGTNGKGSVSAILTSTLLSTNPPLRVGRYNSPHLVTIYDSITIDNVPVLPSFYNSIRAEVESAVNEHQTRLSNFEILTLVALQVFERYQVDIVVLEVGMGGRLDATNIVPDDFIAVSALTAVDLDHQSFLGDTVSKIAQEKAGIGRKCRSFVLGKQKHQGVKDAVREVLHGIGSVSLVDAVDVQVRKWDEAVDGPRLPPFSLAFPQISFQPPAFQPVSVLVPCFPKPVDALFPLHGSHQLDNLGTALTVINELLESPPLQDLVRSLSLKERLNSRTVATGIQNVKWPGRLSFHTLHISPESAISSRPTSSAGYPLVVLADGAHNPASAATLGKYITDLLGLALESETRLLLPASTPINIDVAYVLALSHSPPKTPFQILSPILPPELPTSFHFPNNLIKLKTRVALLSFTPPEGMPWIKSVPPKDLEPVVRHLVPDVDLLTMPDLGASYTSGAGNRALESALKWIADRQLTDIFMSDRTGQDPGRNLGLVVLAGSLYLVADFYRILNNYETASCKTE